ncbi:hypothetical protein L5515_005555 [Caenorhabditis briggsae]|uniref:Uncharacterized protein n=1 Tax=Caenorhabditis briggsae TaxID=6238 RepID=A0AAE9ENQ9_CAEBR|nr:hypothetical protein L5515_005555 [Caenorhabditis briggsae]
MVNDENNQSEKLFIWILEDQDGFSKLSEKLVEIAKNVLKDAGKYGKQATVKIGEFVSNSTKINETITGLSVGTARNAANYVVQVGGRSSNILNIFDKNHISTLGNPKWYARIDMPHGNVPYHHINVNKAITGVKDPHTPISGVTAHAAGLTGRALQVLNGISPALTALALFENVYQVGNNVIIDLTNDTKRNTIEALAKLLATYRGANLGAMAGAALGTTVLPGVGTLAGGVAGAALGANAFSSLMGKVMASALDTLQMDIIQKTCEKCQKEYQCRKSETGDINVCDGCRTDTDVPQKMTRVEIIGLVVEKIRSKL